MQTIIINTQKNPAGGRPKKLGSIDWDLTQRGIMRFVGYSPDGKKILMRQEELEKVANEIGSVDKKRESMFIKILRRFLNSDQKQALVCGRI